MNMAAAMFIDLDGFKSVNDIHGHSAGDQLLKDVARRLESTVREIDTVARIGGDEFMVVLTELEDKDGTCHVAERIISEMAAPFIVNDTVEVNIGTSIGVAFYTTNGDNPEQILKKADAAMYEVKRCGKNHFQFAA
jgi:diguanylate cyclase (GGDEF)-like protein